VRSVSSVALQLLRSIEEMLLKGATHNLIVRTRSEIALYLLNHKRAHLRSLEERFRITIMVNADAGMTGQVTFLIERGEQVHSLEQAKALAAQAPAANASYREDAEPSGVEEETPELPEAEEMVSDDEAIELAGQGPSGPADQDHARGDEQGASRKRRRRKRGRRSAEGREEDAEPDELTSSSPQPPDVGAGDDNGRSHEAEKAANAVAPAESNGEGERRRRRRGRRGGRRNRRERESHADMAADTPAAQGMDLDFHPDGTAELETSPAPVAELPSPQVVAERPMDEPASEQADAQTTPLTQPAEQSLPAAPASEQPTRRRSTVREPALASLHDQSSESSPPLTPSPPSAEPVVSSSTENETGDRPRRSGWWSKRIMGRP
jgi:ribonuclease E